MVDLPIAVCCMCGDVGFSDKLFLCHRCKTRFQHSYCSNYHHGESKRHQLCDWCIHKEKNIGSGVVAGASSGSSSSSISLKKQQSSNGRGGSSSAAVGARSESSCEKTKTQNGEEGAAEDKGKTPSASPRPTARRYKLLKDVMC